jgi:hypothetical protein
MLSRILSTLPRWLAPAAIALGLAACGGGGGASMSGPTTGAQGCSASTCGNAVVTLTDAPGDFASYKVNVTSLTLTKADGTVVETLPVTTSVDFTQLINVTELVSSAAIPQGEYVAATMTLDYSNASIYVYTDASNTQTQQVAQVQDSSTPADVLWSSTPPAPTSSTITVTVQLDTAHHLVITPGKLARLALDFNVAQSNTVDLSNPAAPVVTVLPALVASVVPSDTKDIRVRGALAGVDTTNNAYTINVAPFDDHDAKQGQVVVQTTAATVFEVDGVTKNQTDGLAALAADGAGTMTVAFGALSKTDHSFTATHVLAGSSVQSAKLDRLQGVVTSRPACPSTAPGGAVCLVVRAGRIEDHENGDCQFSARDVALTISGGTTVTSATAEPSAAALSWPSVGSKITAFGTRGTDTQGNPTFDATAGRLRLELTSLWGMASANGIGTGQVTLGLQAIESLPVSAFTFTGTGTTTAQDSNPQSYVVTTGALPLPTIGTSPAALKFYGLVQPFGSAPPDFNAQTLVNFSGTSAALAASFGLGSTAALAVTATGDLTLNVTDPLLGWMHYIKIGPQLIDLTKLAGNVTIAPDPASTGPFAIRSEGSDWHDSVNEYNSGSDFVTALGAQLAGGAKVEQVFAIGQYDQTANTLTAQQVTVTVH